jgi:predicted protein tyrosine phosphatase
MSRKPKTVPVIEIVPRVQASELLLSKSRGASIGCLVSIGDPGQRHPEGFERIAQRLRLEFHDVLENSDMESAPCAEDVERIVRFAERNATADLKVLVHCEAGISRSTAAALILYAVWLGPGAEDEAVARVIASVPEARPNRTIVRLADEALERRGALLAAVARRFDGAPSQ